MHPATRAAQRIVGHLDRLQRYREFHDSAPQSDIAEQLAINLSFLIEDVELARQENPKILKVLALPARGHNLAEMCGERRNDYHRLLEAVGRNVVDAAWNSV